MGFGVASAVLHAHIVKKEMEAKAIMAQRAALQYAVATWRASPIPKVSHGKPESITRNAV